MVLVTVAGFSPLVIPPNRFEPILAGIPLTLWAGVLVALAMILLTVVGAYVHPGRHLDESDGQ